MAGTPRERRSVSASKMSNIEKYNSERGANRRRPPKSSDDDPEKSRIKSTLQKYLAEMKKDHVYVAKNVLAAARMDLNRQYIFQGNEQGGTPGIIYDEESPFKNMKSIETTATDVAQRANVFKFKVTRYTKPNTSAPPIYIDVPTVLATVAEGTPLPKKCRSYTTLRNNIVADNEEEMRYLPYFGEAADDDVLHELNLDELYIDKTKESADEGRIMEYAAMCGIFINDFLAEVNVSLDAVIQYLIGDIGQIHGGQDPIGNMARRAKDALPEDLDLHDFKIQAALQSVQPVEPSELEVAEKVCNVFMEATKISLWEVVKKTSRAVKNSMSPTKHTTTGTNAAPSEKGDKEVAALTGGNPWPYSLDSYASLNCLICYMHECPFHAPSLGKTETSFRRHDGDSSQDENSLDNEYKLSINIPGWSYSSKQAMMDPFAENEFCSPYCFKQASNIETVVARQWTPAQIDLLRNSAAVLRNNPRCACLCAAIINKPCAEIYIRLGEENLLPLKTSDELLGNSEAAHPEPIKILKRKKTPAGFLTGYPADTDRTHLHQERPDVHPCRHVGPCNSSCECVRNHVTCEKACACPPNCPRKWRGCSCKRGGRPCTSDKCICFKANRECDPDLCGTCGAYEILDPVNRYNRTITTPDMCQNVCIQREMSKKTLLGHSVVSGMGLFICEDVPKGGYIGEYKGEIVTNEEAERRGKLYDKRGTSFLFTLNLAQAIDATRMGNKFRFINHSHQRPNCQAKVTMANCAHRIGFYATRALRAGEELFFDYGYNQKCVKFVQKEPPPLPKDIISSDEENLMPPKAARGRGEVEKPHRTRGPPEYLKGGKGTTERSRNYASPSIPESAGTPSAAQPSLSPEPSRRAAARAKRGKKRKRASSDYVRDSSPDVPPIEVEQEEEAPQQQLSDDELSEYEETQEEIVGEEEEDQEESESDHARPPLKRSRRSERVVEEEPQAKRPRGRWSGGGSYNLWRSGRGRVRRF